MSHSVNPVTLLSDTAARELLSLRPIKPSIVTNARKVTDLINGGIPLVKACINSGISSVTYRRCVYAGKVTPPVEWELTPQRFGALRLAEFQGVSKKVMANVIGYHEAAKAAGYDSYLLWIVQNDAAQMAAHEKAVDAARAAAGSNTSGVTDDSGMCGGRLFSEEAPVAKEEPAQAFYAPDILGLKEWAAAALPSPEEEQAARGGGFRCTVSVGGREVGVATANSMEELVAAASEIANAETARANAAAHQARGIERLLTMERNARLMREIGAISRRIEEFRERVSAANQASEKDPVLHAFHAMGLEGKATVAGVIGR